MDGEDEESSPYLSDYIFKCLDSALDYGISERDFWDMTLAELARCISSKKRIEHMKMQQKATMDYVLADLIGRSVSRCFEGSNSMPALEEAYSFLFDEESKREIEKRKQEQQDELSALRFKLFAESFNARFKEVAKD